MNNNQSSSSLSPANSIDRYNPNPIQAEESYMSSHPSAFADSSQDFKFRNINFNSSQQENQNRKKETKQSRLLKLIDHDGYVVNDFNQSIDVRDNPSGSITSESSKNKFIQNDELQRHSIIYNNQNRGEIANNIGSFDFEAEIKKLLAVQKKYRDIHDQKEQEKTKISQQKGKCKVVDESEDEFQLNHFNPNRYKMLEIQQNESMIDKKDTKHRNYTKEKHRKIRKAKQYDAYQNQSSQEQYEHFGKAKKNPLQPILANPTIDIINNQMNNIQINAVIRNESLCERLCNILCCRKTQNRNNHRVYQDHKTSPQNLNTSRLDATNIINTSRFDATNINDISAYSYRNQGDSSRRQLVNHKSSFERVGRKDPDKLAPQKAKKGMFR